MTNAYLWIKVLHILAIISWMAGMLYLPRLFVYHARSTAGLAAGGNLCRDGTPAHAGDHAARHARDVGERPYPCVSGRAFCTMDGFMQNLRW